jgi:hypothetical protein
VCGSLRGNVRLSGSGALCDGVRVAVQAVAVRGSVQGGVQQCVRQCATVRAALYGSAPVSVRLSGSAAVLFLYMARILF